MKKLKFPIKETGKYMREVSVVIIGVAITLLAGYLINNNNEKRDMTLYLNAIKLELEENIKTLDKEMVFLQKQVEYTNYLKTHDEKSINFDTIAINYGNNIWMVQNLTYNNYAFEMFKQSGNMRLIDDKELLLSIWKAYTSLERLEYSFTENFKWKIEEIKSEMSNVSQILEGEKLKNIPMHNFYTTPLPNSMLQNCRNILVLLKKTVSKLENKPSETSISEIYKITNEDLDKYLGVYSSNQILIKLTITKDEGKLICQGTGQSSFHLDATEKDKFEFARAGIILEFNPTDKTMVMKQNGVVYNFTKED